MSKLYTDFTKEDGETNIHLLFAFKGYRWFYQHNYYDMMKRD